MGSGFPFHNILEQGRSDPLLKRDSKRYLPTIPGCGIQLGCGKYFPVPDLPIVPTLWSSLASCDLDLYVKAHMVFF